MRKFISYYSIKPNQLKYTFKNPIVIKIKMRCLNLIEKIEKPKKDYYL